MDYNLQLINRNYSDNDISVWVRLGFINTCFLTIVFRDDHLIFAGICGGDGPTDIFDDAPKSIGKMPSVIPEKKNISKNWNLPGSVERMAQMMSSRMRQPILDAKFLSYAMVTI